MSARAENPIKKRARWARWMADPTNARKRKRYQRRWAAKRYHERRGGLVQILGGKCDRCGATEEIEIHHNSGSTALRITQLIVGYSVARICRMLRDAGVELLCDECHNGVTHETWVANREREVGEDDVPEAEMPVAVDTSDAAPPF